MSDVKSQAVEVYKKHLLSKESHEWDTDQNTEERLVQVKAFVLAFLCTCAPENKFQYIEIQDIILKSASMPNFVAAKCGEAFRHVEGYIILLCLMPWKQEFCKLKKYGGFFRTKVESHLKNVESLFRKIGYRESSSQLLKLDVVPPPDILLYIAFECLMASVECEIIGEIWKLVEHTGIKVFEVVKFRLQTQGSAASTAEIICSKYGMKVPQKVKQAEGIGTDQHLSRGSSSNDLSKGSRLSKGVNLDSKTGVKGKSTEDFRNRLQQHLQLIDIPYMDEETKELDAECGDIDEHVLASIKHLDDKYVTPDEKQEEVVNPLKPSQEWSFVNEGLMQKYGEKYFEGPRKDFLKETPLVEDVSGKPTYVRIGASHVYANEAAERFAKLPYSSQINDVKSHQILSKDSGYVTNSTREPFTEANFSHSTNIPNVTHPRINPHNYQGNRFSEPSPSNNNLSYEGQVRRQKLPSASEVIQRSTQSGSHTIPFAYPAKNTVPTGSFTAPVNIRSVSDGSNPLNVKYPPQILSTGSTRAVGWSCKYCTYKNSLDWTVCEICGKSRGSLELDGPPLVGYTSRICVHCTLENDVNTTICHACGAALSGSQTVV
ncbi:uncharacterized protein LOC127845788 isoform X2 [Dreissena polymorpha]|uniref:RanBP2-type domain-containing protein n=2 Tax=Dreissena polymorpha TaxID=45954 RepID=A0A9D4E4Z7_DREPO|nr:uncharacterized protein LOC127845788 isoform X2 [Dreissena polymorpha]XP_052232895.1 uncharacterized protein LOC127845788 isoform X2 [Dreissena polymorpha]XP_052232896.1 uncharacterized protein LOC127845788 isoform X2 [Dreissena polymorpha]KAH3773964.1 hypothetical protein DPMN_175335 [Dreissena polymorpha]